MFNLSNDDNDVFCPTGERHDFETIKKPDDNLHVYWLIEQCKRCGFKIEYDTSD